MPDPLDVTITPKQTIASDPPVDPIAGDLWWNRDTGQQNIYYDDGDSKQWVIANWGSGKPGVDGDTGPPGLPGIPGPPGADGTSTGVRPGEYLALVNGDAVRNPVTGAWTGTDVTLQLRNAWINACNAGKKLYIKPGNYIITDYIVKSGDAFDGCGIRGEPGLTVIIQKTASKSKALTLFLFDGVLEADGMTGDTPAPTIFMTAPAEPSTDVLQLNTIAGIEVDKPIMLVDMTNGLYQFSSATEDTGYPTNPLGYKIGSFGQVTNVVQIAGDPPETRTVVSGAYQNGEGGPDDPQPGTVTLNVDLAFTIGQNYYITVSDLTGTGANLKLLEGEWRTATGTSGTKILYYAEDGLGPITITGGTVKWNILTANQIRIRPGLEAHYAGSPTTPFTSATCIRRLSKSPRNVTFSGMWITNDPTEPNIGTQRKVMFRALDGPKCWDCRFDATGYGVSVVDGTHQFDVYDCKFYGGGNAHYNISLSACYMGRITRCHGYYGRHHTNTTANLITCATAHILTTSCQSWGMALSAYTDHPGNRNMTWVDCLAVGLVATYPAAAFQLRGTNQAVINCRSYGFFYGIYAVFGSNTIVDGGLISGSNIGIYVAHSPYIVVKNYPRIIDSVLFHVLIDQVVNDSIDVPPPANPYQIPYPGLRIEAEFQGVPANADVAVMNRSPDLPYKFGSDWQINCRAIGKGGTNSRAVKYLSVTKSFTKSNFPWPTEYGSKVATRFLSWAVATLPDTSYICDSTTGTVPLVATLYDPGLTPGGRLWFKKQNTGGQPVQLAGQTIDGVVGPLAIPDGGKVALLSNVQKFPINATGNTYNVANGAVLLAMSEAHDLVAGMKITISGATGTGADIASLNGTWTLNAGSFEKQMRLTIALGKVITTITGGTVTFGGWQTQ